MANHFHVVQAVAQRNRILQPTIPIKRKHPVDASRFRDIAQRNFAIGEITLHIFIEKALDMRRQSLTQRFEGAGVFRKEIELQNLPEVCLCDVGKRKHPYVCHSGPCQFAVIRLFREDSLKEGIRKGSQIIAPAALQLKFDVVLLHKSDQPLQIPGGKVLLEDSLALCNDMRTAGKHHTA